MACESAEMIRCACMAAPSSVRVGRGLRRVSSASMVRSRGRAVKTAGRCPLGEEGDGRRPRSRRHARLRPGGARGERAAFHAPWEAAVVAIMRRRRGRGSTTSTSSATASSAWSPAALPRLHLLRALAGRHRAHPRREGRGDRRRAGGAHGVLRRAPGRPASAPSPLTPSPPARARRPGERDVVPRRPVRAALRARATAVIDAQHPPVRPHAAAALRARQARRDRRAPRLPRLPRHQCPRSRRAAPAALQRPLRRARAVGRGGRAATSACISISGRAICCPAEARGDAWARTIRTSTTTSSRACARSSRCSLEKGILLARRRRPRRSAGTRRDTGPHDRRAGGGARLERPRLQAAAPRGLAAALAELGVELRHAWS